MFRLRDGPAPPLRPMVASDGRMHSTGEQPLDHIASVHHTHSACFARCLDNGLSMKKVAKRVLRRCRHLYSGTADGAVVGLERTVIAAYSAGLRRSWGSACGTGDLLNSPVTTVLFARRESQAHRLSVAMRKSPFKTSA